MSPVDRRKFLKSSVSAGVSALAGAHGLWSLPLDGNVRAVPHDLVTPPWPVRDYPVKAVPMESVRITDSFWRPRMEVNRDMSLGHCFERFDGDSGFSVSKLVEGAAYMLSEEPDPALQTYVEGRMKGLLKSLERRVQTPEQTVRVSGHFLEAAVAYYRVTGKRRMLDAAIRIADLMDQAYGPGKQTYISGHQGLKMGLVSLFRATGEERYWKLAKFFADERGKDDYERFGEYSLDRTYAQDHKPVVEQSEAVGHCVRATFLYIPMTDLAVLASSEAYRNAVDRIWADVVLHKTYLTGGIGSVRFHEQFGEPYELPNLSAWNETCAAYGTVVWNHRMFLLKRHAQYIDVMERVLYNALLVGVSLEGDRFFYQNPLKSFGNYERFEWINVPCCPPNVVRLIASVGEYVYATDSLRDLYVNLFVESQADVELESGTVRIRQHTRYPYDGAVRFEMESEGERTFALHVRIPGWARDTVLPGRLYSFTDLPPSQPALRVNDEPVPVTLQEGYVVLDRTWKPGDVVDLDLPMPVRPVHAHPMVEDDRGRVALQRGPLVYCAEWPDNGGSALNLMVPERAPLTSEFRSDLLDGIQVVQGQIQAVERAGDARNVITVPRELTAIPYFAWANRGMGEMAVWMARDPEKAWLPPVLPAHIAQVRTSGGVERKWTGYNDQNDDLGAIYDGREPLNSADQSHRFFRMRPPVGERAWLEYHFNEPATVSSTRVYWFADKRFCRLPASWRLLYRDVGGWIPVDTEDPFDVLKDEFNRVSFSPVATTAVRMEVEPQTVRYRSGEIGPPDAMFISQDLDWRELGIIEWDVE